MSIKLVIGQKDGQTVQKELDESQTNSLQSKKIGDKLAGGDFGFDGYEFEITGGSDNSGTPMRKDLDGSGKRKILTVEGIGVNKKRHGQKQRKTVAGNTVGDTTAQVNVKVLKAGKAPLVEKPAEEAAEGGDAGDAKEEAPAEEKKEAPAEEKKEEAPAEEKKEEAKPEEKAEEKKE